MSKIRKNMKKNVESSNENGKFVARKIEKQVWLVL